jgi:hypothetical protein
MSSFVLQIHILSGHSMVKKDLCCCLFFVDQHMNPSVWRLFHFISSILFNHSSFREKTKFEPGPNPRWDSRYNFPILELEKLMPNLFQNNELCFLVVDENDVSYGHVILSWSQISKGQKKHFVLASSTKVLHFTFLAFKCKNFLFVVKISEMNLFQDEKMKSTLRLRVELKELNTEYDTESDLKSKRQEKKKAKKPSVTYSLEIRVQANSLEIIHILSGHTVGIKSRANKNGTMQLTRVEKRNNKSNERLALKVSTLHFTDDPELMWLNNATKGLYGERDVTTYEELKSKMGHLLLRGIPSEKIESVKELIDSCSFYAVDGPQVHLMSSNDRLVDFFDKSSSFKFYFSSKPPSSDPLTKSNNILCHGILGAIPLLSSVYLVVAREVSCVGRLPSYGGGFYQEETDVFLIDQIDLIPVPPQASLPVDRV